MYKNKNFFQVIGGWFRRMFMGGSKEFAKEQEENNNKINDVEEIVSPGKQILRNFMERKLAVGALCVVICMFLVVFIGPLFMKNYSDSYTEATQKNIQPCLNMMSVPSELKNDIKEIDSYGAFSVGLSNSGKVYVWGATKLGTTGYDVKNIPEEVQKAKIVRVAAGIDHIIAIDENGKVYGWGNNRLGQYGPVPEGKTREDFPNIIYMPDDLTIDVNNIKRFECAYQCTAILMNDGTLYIWGNKLAYANIDKFVERDNLVDIDFTLNYIVGIPKEGKSVYTGTRGLFAQVRSNMNTSTSAIKDYLGKRKIIGIYAGSDNICLQLDDNSVCFAGDFGLNSTPAPTLADGEYYVQVDAGTHHYTGLTNNGNVYSWGTNTFGECDAPGTKVKNVSSVFGCAFQNYAVDANGKLLKNWGLSGYIFGTDGYGADIFQRIINGGRMTMTIGAVAVIISSIIGIIIGCISGYFGGKVDIILMRVTEIFNAIPFLPFALILSSVMTQMTISQDMRIFIIMCILGVLTWPGLARLVRGQVLVTRENEYVVAAQSMGVKESRIAFKHILPNVISVILVSLTLDFAGCMLTESSLSYLGFGVTYPRPTWGNMLNAARNATIIKNYWWQWLFTSIFLAITTICINIVGDALRDVMDPKSNIDK